MTLNIQQKKAVEKIKGPTIVLAGAGTGKTFTIVEKIKLMVNSGRQIEKRDNIRRILGNGGIIEVALWYFFIK